MEEQSLKDKLKTYDFQALFKKKGYAYFTKGSYNLNIIGIRSNGSHVTNCFDDYLVLIFNTPRGIECRKIYNITTDPGITYMISPGNKQGTAILVPGQYRSAYEIDKHKGKYYALCQKKPVKVYRDNNKDEIYDWKISTIKKGIFGINIHKAGKSSKRVNNWSAGCQVFAYEEHFVSFMRYCRLQIEQGLGKTFTYTLLLEEDLE